MGFAWRPGGDDRTVVRAGFGLFHPTVAVQGVRDQLPVGTEATLGPMAGATSEIYLYTLEDTLHRAQARSDSALMALRTLHDRVVRPQLRSVPASDMTMPPPLPNESPLA